MMLASPTFSSLARTNSWKKVPKSQLNQFAMVNASMDCSAPEEVESFSPGKRYCHTAVVLDDSSRLVVFGGGSVIPDREYLNDTWELDTETMDWKELKCQGEIPAGRLGHTANLVNNKMYVFGGYDGESLRNELFVLDLETCQWTEVKDPEGNGPTPRSQHSSAVLGDKIIIFGGYDSEEQNDVFVFDTVTQEWAELDVQGKNLPVSRYQHTSCCAKVNGRDALIVFGGFDSNQKCLGDLWALMMDTFEWQELKTTGESPCPRGGHRVFVHEHFVGVFGGEGDDDKRKDDLFVIDTDTLEWRELKIQDPDNVQNNIKEKGGRKAPSPRYCHSCSVVKSTGEIVLLGGRDEDSTLFGSVWTLNTFSLFLYQTRYRRASFSTSLSCLLTPQFTQDLGGLMYSPSPLFSDASLSLVQTTKESTKRKVN